MKLIYFHGGGFVSGNKEDFPKEIKRFFLNLGLEIITLDYPLAPETKLDDIIAWCIKNIPDTNDLIYFGRSAGAFLAFACAQYKKPKAIIDFYGYSRLNKDWMNKNPYINIPKISKNSFDKLIDSGLKDRYSVYIYARQNKQWFNFLDTDEIELNLDNIPPTFIWHSLFDPDVPYKEAKWIYEKVNLSELHTSLNKKHEIDLEDFKSIQLALSDFIIKVK